MKCDNCNNEIIRANKNDYRNKHSFCNPDCYKFWWGKKIAIKFRGSGNVRWDENKVFKKCFVCGTEFRATGARKKYGKFCSRSCVSKWNFTGSRNPKWKGGIPREQRTELPEYEEWRKEVYKRDGWKCKICKTGGKQIIAHHVRTYKHFLNDRFKVENGLTLCRACHIKLHTIHKDVIDFTVILRDYMPNTEK